MIRDAVALDNRQTQAESPGQAEEGVARLRYARRLKRFRHVVPGLGSERISGRIDQSTGSLE